MMEIEKELLMKKGFYVEVKRVGEIYKVTYPPHTILKEKSPSFNTTYTLVEDGVVMGKEFVLLAAFLRRLAIIADIFSQCHYLHISPELVFYVDSEGRLTTWQNLITIDMTEEDLKKEETVRRLMFKEDVSTEQSLPLFRSYKLIFGLLQ